MKIRFAEDRENSFYYHAHYIGGKRPEPLGVWHWETVDKMMEDVGLRETTTSIKCGPNCDFVVDFNKKEIEFL